MVKFMLLLWKGKSIYVPVTQEACPREPALADLPNY